MDFSALFAKATFHYDTIPQVQWEKIDSCIIDFAEDLVSRELITGGYGMYGEDKASKEFLKKIPNNSLVGVINFLMPKEMSQNSKPKAGEDTLIKLQYARRPDRTILMEATIRDEDLRKMIQYLACDLTLTGSGAGIENDGLNDKQIQDVMKSIMVALIIFKNHIAPERVKSRQVLAPAP